jgi:hypothetical protein
MRGNIITFSQNATKLLDVLPNNYNYQLFQVIN